MPATKRVPPAPASQALALDVVEGPSMAYSMPPTCAAKVTVGRTKASAMHVRDPGVSEKHALFQWNGATWTVTDVGSSNGTAVNGDDLVVGVPRVVATGDVVQLGLDSSVRVRVGDADAPHTAPKHDAPVPQVVNHGAKTSDVTVEQFLEAEGKRLAQVVRDRAQTHCDALRDGARLVREEAVCG